jgi:hypothetical protein
LRIVAPALFCTLSFALGGCGGGSGGSALPPQAASRIAASALSASSVDAASTSAYAGTIVSDGAIAYYPLGDSNSTMVDYSGHHLNGAYGSNVRLGGPVFTSAGNASAMFPGRPAGSDVPSNAGTVVANSLFATARSAVSLEAWIKLNAWNTTNNFQPIVSYGRDVQGEPWIVELTPQSTLQVYLKTSSGSGNWLLKPASSRITPGVLYHVVVTYNGASANLYVNGALSGTIAATGALNYSGVQSQYGLGIGGALGGTRPIFNGSISDVSIYPTALSAASVQNHFIKGQLAAFVSEAPKDSDAFVDSIGVNTHMSASGTSYTSSSFISLLEASGIRHVRDGLQASPSWYAQTLKRLGAAGIHASLVMNPGQTAQQITSTVSGLKGSIEAVEGLNEPDDHGQPASVWIPAARSAQQTLWSTVKGNAATASLHVVGPSIVSESNHAALGNLSTYMDRGNIHDYFSNFNPGTSGWGGLDRYGIYGSISSGMNVSAINSGSNPIWATEAGYQDAGTTRVDDRTLARYVPRLFLENFLHNIDRTTIYAFYDDGGIAPDHFGLVTPSNAPKSSYYAIKSLIHSLADPGPTFSSTSLSYMLAGSTSNVQHLLLQKRDGTYELVLWVETESYNPSTFSDIVVSAQTLTLKPAHLPSTASITTIGDSGNATSIPLAFPGGIASFAIDDHVTIVSFK